MEDPRVERALAEVWLVVWRRSDSLPEEPEAARRWVFVVAANVVRSVRRRIRRRRRLEEHLLDASARSVGSVDEDRAAHLAAWAALTESDRVVLRVAATTGPGRPLAEVLGVTDGVAAARLHRARARLRALLER